MHDNYEVPIDCSELTEQEYADHEFIEQYLSLEEIESIALACERVEDVIQAQYYFARAKSEGSTETLGLLEEIIQDKIKIVDVRMGIPNFTFFS